MKTSFVSRTLTIATAAAMFAFQSTAAHAGPAKGLDLMTGRSAADAADLPANSKRDSGVTGTLSPSALSAPVLNVTLADGSTVQAHLQRVAQDSQKGTQSWVGTFDDAPGSSLVLSKTKGVISGFVTYQGQTLEIMPTRGGKHVVYSVDSSRLPQRDGVNKASSTSADALSTSMVSAADAVSSTATGGVVQDVLVLYTPASASRYGQATIESMIQSAVQTAIQAYQNSFVNVTLNIVGLQQAPMSEVSGMQNTLTALANNTTIRALRNKLVADMVVLVSENSDYCGWAGVGQGPDGGTDAYAVVWSSCLSSYSFAHEVGHLQGLDHNRENGGSGGIYPYGFGYRVCAADGFRDVMSYQCPSIGVPRILQFSNPSVYYNGYPTGIDYDLHPSTAADTHRALNNSALTVAAYRTSGTSTSPPPTAPNAPSGLAASSVAYNAVSLTWSDTSSDESGFKVERSPDGVNFTEIATLGAGTTAYRDASVNAKANYYYRVRSYNSVGSSGYSNTLGVTTPDVPPPPPAPPALPAAPSSVTAIDDRDGTASVSWASASTTATGYDVMREKYDSRRRVWNGATTVASVTSSYTSIVDSSGAGTWRYSVRAKNAGGASAYAGPATVTVTVPPSSKRGRNK